MIVILSLFLLLLPHVNGVETSGRVLSRNRKPVSFVALWLEGGNRKIEPLPSATIDQHGKAFVPHVLVVPRGTTVSFPNNDLILHNVYAQFEAKRFDLGLYPKGQSKKQAFDKAGIVAVRCNIHSTMSAYVVVVDTPYYALTDAEGRFQFSGAPPAGTYTLHLWHESGVREQRSLVLKENAPPLELVLSQR